MHVLIPAPLSLARASSYGLWRFCQGGGGEAESAEIGSAHVIRRDLSRFPLRLPQPERVIASERAASLLLSISFRTYSIATTLLKHAQTNTMSGKGPSVPDVQSKYT